MWQSTHRDWFLTVNQSAQSTRVLHAPMRLYAESDVTLFAAVLLVAWWWARRDRNARSMAAAPWVPAGALLALGLNQPLVNLAHEPRPYPVLRDALVLVAHSQDYSFPSDHAVLAGRATCLGYLAVRTRLILVVTGLTRRPLRPLLTTADGSRSR